MKDSNVDVASAASGYIRYVRSLQIDHDPDAIWSPETDPDCRAYDLVGRTIRNGDAVEAWSYTCEVLRQETDDESGHFAAGPLGDCVCIHGSALVDTIEVAAAADERLRWALGGIWRSTDSLPEPVLRRIVHASGGEARVLERIPLLDQTDSPRNDVAQCDSLSLKSCALPASASPADGY